MTLIVTTYRRDASTGAYVDEPYPEGPGADLAGLEIWRTAVWGSEAARRRGARFLPELARGDLYVEREDLAAFCAECRALLEDVEAFAAELGADAAGLALRLRNFLAAAARVDPITGGVRIG